MARRIDEYRHVRFNLLTPKETASIREKLREVPEVYVYGSVYVKVYHYDSCTIALYGKHDVFNELRIFGNNEESALSVSQSLGLQVTTHYDNRGRDLKLVSDTPVLTELVEVDDVNDSVRRISPL